MKIRPSVFVAGLTLAALVSVGLAAENKDYQKDLRAAQSQQRSKRYRECLKACDQMLEAYKETWQAKELTWLKVETLVLDSQYEATLKALADLAKAYSEDKELQAAAALRTGDVQRLLKKPEDAVAVYRKLAEAAAKDQPEQAAEALLRAGETLAADLKKPDQALALYREVESKFAALDAKRAAEALRRIATAHEAEGKDFLKAAAAYQALTEKHAAVFDDGTLAGLCGKAVECFLKAEKPAEATAAARKAEESLKSVGLKASFGIRLGDLLLEQKRPAEARAEYQRIICSYPLEQGACQNAQAKIVEAYRAESQWADALGAARILYDAAGDESSIRNAAQVVAQAFLAADGSLGRANDFLAYQRFGPDGPDGKPKTEDDIAANRLAEVKYPTPSAAANQQFQAAVKAQPDGYEGYRAKGFLYVYWGKPKEGAGQFRLAFKAATLNQVPAASQELVLVGMKAFTASFRGLDRIFEYLSYGPKGKSGKENLPDPFAGL